MIRNSIRLPFLLVPVGLLAVTGPATPTTSVSLGSIQQEEAYVCPPCGESCHQATFPEPGSCGTCGMGLVPVADVTHVAVLLHPGVDLTTSMLPLSLLASTGIAIVYTVADTRDSIRAEDTLEIVPQYAVHEAPQPDVLVLPSGRGAYEDALLVDWVAKASAGADVVLSIGVGNVLLAKAGMLDDLPDGEHVPIWEHVVPHAASWVEGVSFSGDSRVDRAGKFLMVRDAEACLEATLSLVTELGGGRRAERSLQRLGFGGPK